MLPSRFRAVAAPAVSRGSQLSRAGEVGVVLLLAGLVSMLGASPASAHGIGGDAASSSIGGFVTIGIEHMLLGWDHLLFVAGIVLLAGNARRGAKVITAFVAGHSLTLITATLAGWQVNPTAVDVVIVLSVAFVGGYGMFGAPKRWDIFTALVFGFGLVHGLGLATRFQALGVADDGLVWRLIAFNVGIEIGQLTTIIAVLAGAAVISMLFRARHDVALAKVAFVALFAVGAMTAPLLALNAFQSNTDGGNLDVALPANSGCTISKRTETLPAAGGEHADKAFYAPDEEAPATNFGHSLGDGYVIVLYPQDASVSAVTALREFVDGGDPPGVLAGARDEPSGQVTALTVSHEMTCDSVHVGALRQFSRAWIESIGTTS